MANEYAVNHGATLVPHRPVEVHFSLVRGSAIDWYARYEQALLRLFATLLNAEIGYANIPFFRLNNARARIAILEKFLKKRHGPIFNIFWNSVSKELMLLDERRNHLAHWAQAVHMNQTGVHKVTLVPPHYWDNLENIQHITVEDIYEFIAKCDYFSRLITVFEQYLSPQKDTFFPHGEERTATWLKIFEQPITYPPPDNHPLFRKPITP